MSVDEREAFIDDLIHEDLGKCLVAVFDTSILFGGWWKR